TTLPAVDLSSVIHRLQRLPLERFGHSARQGFALDRATRECRHHDEHRTAGSDLQPPAMRERCYERTQHAHVVTRPSGSPAPAASPPSASSKPWTLPVHCPPPGQASG